MKHTLKATAILILIFITAQLVGLGTITKYIKPEKITTETGEEITEIKHGDTVIGPQPEITQKSFSFVPITIAILIGTAILLILIRFRLKKVWKAWFFLAILITLSVSFGIYMSAALAFILAIVLTSWKIFKPNQIIHNITEVFTYTGIAIIVLPFLNITSAFLLLLVISIYDIYAVWKSKHMVKMAKFQTENRLFAGLSIRYMPKREKITVPKTEIKKEAVTKNAILGGGDIAFPLMFSSAILEHLIINHSFSKLMAFFYTLIIPVCCAIALAVLLTKAKKDTFYPAMPFISFGCLIGFIVILIAV